VANWEKKIAIRVSSHTIAITIHELLGFPAVMHMTEANETA